MREVIDFDKNWLFHKGDINYPEPQNKGAMYIGAKTERYHIGPASRFYYANPDSFDLNVEFKPEKWENVDLPHDYIIGGEMSKDNNNALGFFKYENAWYIKRFSLQKSDENKRITLLFEGIATHATVYLNGCLLKHNFCGYTTFEVDITDYVKFDEENVLSVYVQATEHEGWWYEGAGIYRHVKLIKTELVSVDLWGLYVRPVFDGKNWTVKTELTLRNDSYSPKTAEIITRIADLSGKILTKTNSFADIAIKDLTTVKYNLSAENPKLWSPDEPNLYLATAKVYVDGELFDEYSTRFGFRYFKADPNKGFFINGKNYKIKGLCGHADFGLTGKAVSDNIHRYKVRLMKEMGANGYRTSHYPQAEALMDALDENGFIVMDETRWFDSTDEGLEQLKMLVKRDRNRPSVFFWSVGNEEPHHVTEEGRRICKTMMALVRKLDDSRLVLTAVSYPPNKATVYDELDVVGINYNWAAYDEVRKNYPNKMIISSENCATGTTRGWYTDSDNNYAYIPAYDRDAADVDFWARERTWKFIMERDYVAGGYQWIAFEHRGEAVWPRICSQSGAIDLFMQKKDAFYQNKSLWSDAPMIHLLPHWNFKGMEGTPIKVFAYTNLSTAELFLNGVSLGIVNIEPHGHAEWLVDYAPGTLKVVGYDKDGKILATDEKITSGKGEKLAFTLETPDATANGKDVTIFSCYVVDDKGLPVYDACPTVYFTASGSGRVLATGSDVSDHTSVFLPVRRMREGRIGIAVKLSDKHGKCTLTGRADGLKTGVITVEF